MLRRGKDLACNKIFHIWVIGVIFKLLGNTERKKIEREKKERERERRMIEVTCEVSLVI